MNLFNPKRSAPDAETRADAIARATDDLLRYADRHADRIARLADRLAIESHICDDDRGALRLAAHVRDAGLLAMNRDYLLRAGELTPEERVDLARHAIISEGEAARAGFDRRVQILVRWHHENYDGSGYPDALAAAATPLAARILRFADAACALLAARPWRAAFTFDDALARLRESAALEFDPLVVHTFCRLAACGALADIFTPHRTTRPEHDAPLVASPDVVPPVTESHVTESRVAERLAVDLPAAAAEPLASAASADERVGHA